MKQTVIRWIDNHKGWTFVIVIFVAPAIVALCAAKFGLGVSAPNCVEGPCN